jgi:hypothetical protein
LVSKIRIGDDGGLAAPADACVAAAAVLLLSDHDDHEVVCDLGNVLLDDPDESGPVLAAPAAAGAAPAAAAALSVLAHVDHEVMWDFGNARLADSGPISGDISGNGFSMWGLVEGDFLGDPDDFKRLIRLRIWYNKKGWKRLGLTSTKPQVGTIYMHQKLTWWQ